MLYFNRKIEIGMSSYFLLHKPSEEMNPHPTYVYMKYQCKVCNIHSPSKAQWVRHLETPRHRANVAELVEIVPDTDVMKALREENQDLKRIVSRMCDLNQTLKGYLRENGLGGLIE
jgi:hypothetical protein